MYTNLLEECNTQINKENTWKLHPHSKKKKNILVLLAPMYTRIFIEKKNEPWVYAIIDRLAVFWRRVWRRPHIISFNVS